MILSTSKEDPVSRVVAALNCIKERDDHLASDLIDIVAGLLLIAGRKNAVVIPNSPERESE